MDFIYSLFGDGARSKDTLDYATAVAFVGAVIAAAGFVLKDIWVRVAKWLENRARFKSAMVRFHNDVRVWQDDYHDTYNRKQFDRLIETIIVEKEDFKFSVPTSDSTDIRMLNRYMHRLDRVTMQVVRTYVVYYELVLSINEKLCTDEFSEMSKRRKIGTVVTLFQYAAVVEKVGHIVEDKLLPHTHIRKDGSTLRSGLVEALKSASSEADSSRKSALEKLEPASYPDAEPVALSLST